MPRLEPRPQFVRGKWSSRAWPNVIGAALLMDLCKNGSKSQLKFKYVFFGSPSLSTPAGNDLFQQEPSEALKYQPVDVGQALSELYIKKQAMLHINRNLFE